MATNIVPSKKTVIVAKNYPPEWCSSKVKILKCSSTWIINNFSACNEKSGQGLQSPTFTTGDTKDAKWYLRLYPKGLDEESKDYVSIFMYLSSCNSTTTIRAKYDLSIIDSKRKKTFIRHIGMNTYGIGNNWGSSKIIKRDFLLDKSNKLLPNDQLTLLCELGIVEEEIYNSDENSMIPIEMPICQLRQNLGSFLRNDKFSDFTLAAGEQEFRVHKIILAAQSPVFSAMFDHEMKEQKSNRVVITDVDPDVLERMLQFIYTDSVTDVDKIADRLLAAAEKYALHRLSVLCQRSLCQSLELENSVPILILADLHNAKELKALVLNFIITNSKEVVKTEGYNSLINPSHVHLFDEVFRAVISSIENSH